MGVAGPDALVNQRGGLATDAKVIGQPGENLEYQFCCRRKQPGQELVAAPAARWPRSTRWIWVGGGASTAGRSRASIQPTGAPAPRRVASSSASPSSVP